MANMRKTFWKADWFTALLVALLFLFIAPSDLIQSLERKAYDWGVRSSSRVPSDKIAVIAIDDQSIANLGRWPWPRAIQGQMLDILAQGHAKVVGNTVFFSEPPWPLNSRVGANSPSLCPTMFSVINTGICLRPL